jgi:pyridoxal phosphate enzyme (YggS family)
MDFLHNFKNLINDIKDQSNLAKLIVVTKNQSFDKINHLINEGHKDFGENKVQEAKLKWSNLVAKNPSINLHLIGNLQSNKAKDAVNIFNFIHTLSSEKLAKILKNEQEKINKKIKYFIQVNISEESQKNGIELNLVNDFIKFCIHDLSLQIIGLMCLPPVNDIPDFYFTKLKNISTENNLLNLSMGMSNDYVSAIRFGSTHIRIGSKIFGNRN